MAEACVYVHCARTLLSRVYIWEMSPICCVWSIRRRINDNDSHSHSFSSNHFRLKPDSIRSCFCLLWHLIVETEVSLYSFTYGIQLSYYRTAIPCRESTRRTECHLFFANGPSSKPSHTDIFSPKLPLPVACVYYSHRFSCVWL